MKITIILIIITLVLGLAAFFLPTIPGIKEAFLSAVGLLLAAAGREVSITKKAESKLGEKFWKEIQL